MKKILIAACLTFSGVLLAELKTPNQAQRGYLTVSRTLPEVDWTDIAAFYAKRTGSAPEAAMYATLFKKEFSDTPPENFDVTRAVLDAADNGSAEAAYIASLLKLESGAKSAEEYLRYAAAQGIPQAAFHLARSLAGSSPESAIALLRPVAATGDEAAKRLLGALLYDTAPDRNRATLEEAFRNLEHPSLEALEKQTLPSNTWKQLGLAHLGVKGSPEDLQIGFRLLGKAYADTEMLSALELAKPEGFEKRVLARFAETRREERARAQRTSSEKDFTNNVYFFRRLAEAVPTQERIRVAQLILNGGNIWAIERGGMEKVPLEYVLPAVEAGNTWAIQYAYRRAGEEIARHADAARRLTRINESALATDGERGAVLKTKPENIPSPSESAEVKAALRIAADKGATEALIAIHRLNRMEFPDSLSPFELLRQHARGIPDALGEIEDKYNPPILMGRGLTPTVTSRINAYVSSKKSFSEITPAFIALDRASKAENPEKLLREEATAGDKAARLSLGFALTLMPQTRAEGTAMLESLEKEGDAAAARILASMCQDPDIKIARLQNASDKGEIRAGIELAVILIMSRPLNHPDLEKSCTLLLRGYEAGETWTAQYLLLPPMSGPLRKLAPGKAKELSTAYYELSRSRMAYANMGQNNQITEEKRRAMAEAEKNTREAEAKENLAWLKAKAEAGDRHAAIMYGNILYKKAPATLCAEDACLRYWRIAADAGLPEANLLLARTRWEEKPADEAARRFSLAADGGSIEALTALSSDTIKRLPYKPTSDELAVARQTLLRAVAAQAPEARPNLIRFLTTPNSPAHNLAEAEAALAGFSDGVDTDADKADAYARVYCDPKQSDPKAAYQKLKSAIAPNAPGLLPVMNPVTIRLSTIDEHEDHGSSNLVPLESLRYAARNGSTEAAYALSRMRHIGLSNQEAASWENIAIKSGHAGAKMARAKRLLSDTKTSDEALGLIRSAMLSGNTEAKRYYLSHLMQVGQIAEALPLLENEAKTGDMRSIEILVGLHVEAAGENARRQQIKVRTGNAPGDAKTRLIQFEKADINLAYAWALRYRELYVQKNPGLGIRSEHLENTLAEFRKIPGFDEAKARGIFEKIKKESTEVAPTIN